MVRSYVLANAVATVAGPVTIAVTGIPAWAATHTTGRCSMSRFMVVTGGFVALSVAAVGCATAPGAHARWHTGWDKPGMTGEAFEQDVRQCDREAMRMAAAEPGHQTAASGGPRTTGPGPTAPLKQAEHAKAYADCMKARGYTATKPN
jgi:hypothetical protein